MSSILVIFSDRMTPIVAKGEVTDGYLNPGDLFEDVHLLLVNPDHPDPASVQPMAGSARLHIHNIDVDRRVLGARFAWQRRRAQRLWMRRAVDLAREVGPSLVRCHGMSFNGLLAYAIKRELGVPYVISLHINPDDIAQNRPLKASLNTNEWRRFCVWEHYERVVLNSADAVLGVYEAIIPYLRRLGVEHYEIAYNVLRRIPQPRSDRAPARPTRIICVNRQDDDRNPENLVRAMAELPDAELCLVGGGPRHDRLRQVATSGEAASRIQFVQAMPNEKLCAALSNFDIAAFHNEMWGMHKTFMEAMLARLPVVVNRRQRGLPIPELQGVALEVDDSPGGYSAGIRHLQENPTYYRELAARGHDRAMACFAPDKALDRIVEIYRRVLRDGARQPLLALAGPI